MTNQMLEEYRNRFQMDNAQSALVRVNAELAYQMTRIADALDYVSGTHKNVIGGDEGHIRMRTMPEPT